MNKVFNWVFSGFFRTIGRFIVYILLALILGYVFKDTKISDFILFTNVHAEWYDNIQYYPSNVSIYNCTSSTSCSSVNVTLQDLTVDNNVRGSWEMYTSVNDLTVAQNGIVLSNYLQSNLYAGYLYLIQTYFCTSYSGTYSTFQANLNLGWSFANTATPQQVGTTYHNTAISTFGDAIAGNTCYIANSLVVPNGTKQVAGLHLYRSSGSVTTRISLIGFSITNVGLYDAVTNSSLSSAIANSGFATASSVEEVQDSVNAIQDELDATNDAIQEQTEQQQQNHEETINTITNDDSSGASGSAGNFFSNFNTNTHGLTGIITAPLLAIQSLTSQTCEPLVLPLPFVNQNLTLPCMRPIYQQFFGDFMTLYDVITLGIISYWVLVRIFALVKDFKNPEHDEIEVVDL